MNKCSNCNKKTTPMNDFRFDFKIVEWLCYNKKGKLIITEERLLELKKLNNKYICRVCLDAIKLELKRGYFKITGIEFLGEERCYSKIV